MALPSLLAQGNLPALAQSTDLEFCILTSTGDYGRFEARPSFSSLKALCPVRFIAIDDLIGSSIYGITLTLAYTRGIASVGSDMVNVHFMFFNSDFILAAGSLRSLLRHIEAGRHCIFAPSFRASAEIVEPILQKRVDTASHVLTIPPRELVCIALNGLHPTYVAKTLNQSLFRSLYHNQLYWRVDRSTVLARFYLMFMLCIKPERVVRTAAAYCDYGFAPELVPSGDIVFLTDTDEFFMLETQADTHEETHIQLGRHRTADICEYLAEWTTREHRLAAQQDLIFHSKDLPSSIDKWRLEARRYVKIIEKRLPHPQSHTNHPYWVHTVPIWQDQVKGQGQSGMPPELGEYTSRSTLIRAALELLVGTRPNLRIWHHDWIDYHRMRRSSQSVKSPLGTRSLLISEQDPLNSLFTGTPRFTAQAVMTLPKQVHDQGYDDISVLLKPRQVGREGNRLIPKLIGLLRSGGILRVVIHDSGTEFITSNIAEDLMAVLRSAFGEGILDIDADFCGGTVKRSVRAGFRKLTRLYRRWGLRAAPVLFAAVPALFLINLINNLRMLFITPPANPPPDYCSTVIVQIRLLQSRSSSII